MSIFGTKNSPETQLFPKYIPSFKKNYVEVTNYCTYLKEKNEIISVDRYVGLLNVYNYKSLSLLYFIKEE